MKTIPAKAEIFIEPVGTEMTPDLLQNYINKHRTVVNNRYRKLRQMYEGMHPVLMKKEKAQFKPDNRLVANFAKYIVDTLNGYFIGIPIKVNHSDENVKNYIEYVDSYNNQDDNNSELSKLCSIFGRGYELVFTDEEAQIGLTYVSPEEAFIIYDDSLLHRPMFGVRYYKNTYGELEGSWSDSGTINYFNKDYRTVDLHAHYFGGVPLIEYMENNERMGTFETVITLIDAYDNAISEKANDVDYYADAYLKVLGAELDEGTLASLRDNRIINLSGNEAEKIIVEFLQKPESDGTQEHLINRLENLIFHLSMVANINDENFGTATGIALSYKLQSMNNLAKTKERKFTAGLNKRYKLISSIPTSDMKDNDWLKLDYKFTRNVPNNLLEESQIAGNLGGIVSKETQLGVLSCVDNVQSEKSKIEEDNNLVSDQFTRTQLDEEPSEEILNKKEPTMYQITAIITKYKRGSLTYNNALRMMARIGVEEMEAKILLDDESK